MKLLMKIKSQNMRTPRKQRQDSITNRSTFASVVLLDLLHVQHVLPRNEGSRLLELLAGSSQQPSSSASSRASYYTSPRCYCLQRRVVAVYEDPCHAIVLTAEKDRQRS
jgi:hypothetical protein